MGALVQQLCATAREARHRDPLSALLFVNKAGSGSAGGGGGNGSSSAVGAGTGGGEDQAEALFIDTAVYSRNRAFRLYLSS